jgi:hypothetical protein
MERNNKKSNKIDTVQLSPTTLEDVPLKEWTEGPTTPNERGEQVVSFPGGVCYLLWFYEVGSVYILYMSVLIKYYNGPIAK